MTTDYIYKGARVLAFDHKLYKNDIKTPLSKTMKPATVVERYRDYVDVLFDHDNKISKSHFVNSITLIEKLDEQT